MILFLSFRNLHANPYLLVLCGDLVWKEGGCLQVIANRIVPCLVQAKVLLFVSKWFLASGREGARVNLQNPELCLVHGTFGSGKS